MLTDNCKITPPPPHPITTRTTKKNGKKLPADIARENILNEEKFLLNQIQIRSVWYLNRFKLHATIPLAFWKLQVSNSRSNLWRVSWPENRKGIIQRKTCTSQWYWYNQTSQQPNLLVAHSVLLIQLQLVVWSGNCPEIN